MFRPLIRYFFASSSSTFLKAKPPPPRQVGILSSSLTSEGLLLLFRNPLQECIFFDLAVTTCADAANKLAKSGFYSEELNSAQGNLPLAQFLADATEKCQDFVGENEPVLATLSTTRDQLETVQWDYKLTLTGPQSLLIQNAARILREENGTTNFGNENISLYSSAAFPFAPLRQAPQRHYALETTIVSDLRFRLLQELNSVHTALLPYEKLRITVEKKVQRRENFRLLCGLSGLTAQFLVFYYAIYEVEWLGWDLMEPVTFSLQQTLGLYFWIIYCRGKVDIEDMREMLGNLHAKNRARFSNRYGFDYNEYRTLKQKEKELRDELAALT